MKHESRKITTARRRKLLRTWMANFGIISKQTKFIAINAEAHGVPIYSDPTTSGGLARCRRDLEHLNREQRVSRYQYLNGTIYWTHP